MKTIKTFLLVAVPLLFLSVSTAYSQVTPTTTDVKIYCSDGILDLGAPSVAGTVWKALYSTTSTTTPTDPVTLTGNTVANADLTTGYYYFYTVGDATNPQICESEFVEVPVYKFAPLSIAFTHEDYCIENIADQTFTSDVTNNDPHTTLAYQWYIVEGGVETAISGATSEEYTPVAANVTVGQATTFRVKVGYLVGTSRYCSATADKAVTVYATPGTPTITISGETTAETW